MIMCTFVSEWCNDVFFVFCLLNGNNNSNKSVIIIVGMCFIIHTYIHTYYYRIMTVLLLASCTSVFQFLDSVIPTVCYIYSTVIVSNGYTTRSIETMICSVTASVTITTNEFT